MRAGGQASKQAGRQAGGQARRQNTIVLVVFLSKPALSFFSAVFFIQFLLVGYLKSLGLFLVEFQTRYDVTSSMASLMVGILEGSSSLFCE